MLDPFYGGGYAPVDPQDYCGLETLLAQDVDALVACRARRRRLRRSKRRRAGLAAPAQIVAQDAVRGVVVAQS